MRAMQKYCSSIMDDRNAYLRVWLGYGDDLEGAMNLTSEVRGTPPSYMSCNRRSATEIHLRPWHNPNRPVCQVLSVIAAADIVVHAVPVLMHMGKSSRVCVCIVPLQLPPSSPPYLVARVESMARMPSLAVSKDSG